MASVPGNPFADLNFSPKPPPAPPTLDSRVGNEVKQLLAGVVQGVANLLNARGLAYSRVWRLRIPVPAQGNNPGGLLNNDPEITPDLMAQGLGSRFIPLVEADQIIVKALTGLSALIVRLGGDAIPANLLAGVPAGWTLTPSAANDGTGTIAKDPVTITPVA